MNKKLLKFLILALVIGFSVSLLASFIIGWERTVEAISRISKEALFMPFLVYLLVYLIDAIRLKIVARKFGYDIKISDGLSNSVQGYLFSYLTPMAAGGQPFQILHLSKLGVKTEDATNIIFSRFVEYLMTSVLISLIFYRRILGVLRENSISSIIVNLGFVISAGFSVLITLSLFNPDVVGNFLMRLERTTFGKIVGKIVKDPDWGKRAYEWTLNLKESVSLLWGKNYKIAFLDTTLGFIVILIQAYTLFFALKGISGEIPFFETTLLFIFLNLVVYYIPTPGASGSVEGAYSLVYSTITKYPDRTFAAILVWRTATYYLQILFGLVWIWLFSRRRCYEDSGGCGDL